MSPTNTQSTWGKADGSIPLFASTTGLQGSAYVDSHSVCSLFLLESASIFSAENVPSLTKTLPGRFRHEFNVEALL